MDTCKHIDAITGEEKEFSIEKIFDCPICFPDNPRIYRITQRRSNGRAFCVQEFYEGEIDLSKVKVMAQNLYITTSGLGDSVVLDVCVSCDNSLFSLHKVQL